MRNIKLMADYHCFPLWEASPGAVGNIDPEDLPISYELKKRLSTWANKYDQTLDMDYPPNSGFETVEAEVRFKQDGYQLAEQLKAELGAEFSIVVHIYS